MIYKSVRRQNGFAPHYNNVKVQLSRVRCILSGLFLLSKELNDDVVIYFVVNPAVVNPFVCEARIRCLMTGNGCYYLNIWIYAYLVYKIFNLYSDG